jgi:polyhydroxybutyrate depolymerase
MKLVLVAFMVVSGCIVDPEESESESAITAPTAKTINIDGVARTYLLYRPSNPLHDKLPVIVLLHGHGRSTVSEVLANTPFSVWLNLAATERLIVIAPQGSVSPDGNYGWNDCRGDATTNPSTDDVKFISAVIAKAIRKWDADPSRIFVSGMSNGAFMTLRLATEIPDQLAAVAPIAGSMPARSKCAPPTIGVPVMFMNGTEDRLSPYAGGEIAPDTGGHRGTSIAVPDAVKIWSDLEGVSLTRARNLPNLAPADGSTVTKLFSGRELSPQRVLLYRINGGGHTEPSIAQRYSLVYQSIVGRQNHDIEMAAEVWRFFKSVPR